MKTICCIPARFNSSRLIGKPLLKINDKTIINHVYDKAKILNINEIIVLTDDKRIYDEVISFGGNCDISNVSCLNGTERIVEYLNRCNDNYDIVVNIQGDEPFINIDDVNLAINKYIINKQLNKKLVCSTLHYATRDINEIKSKSRGKLVLSRTNNIMYCSRNVIPTSKTNDVIENYDYFIHIGIFVFDPEYLKNEYCKENTPLQLCEDIEWMKIMENGYEIVSTLVNEAEISVDTIHDYEYLINKYK